jgi:MerR family redox-sensitive transcriptional activator SoxR
MSVAEASNTNGLTRRALHFYEEVGLIKADRDPQNRRIYDWEMRRRPEWIGILRRVDVPLSQVADVISVQGGEERRPRPRDVDPRASAWAGADPACCDRASHRPATRGLGDGARSTG